MEPSHQVNVIITIYRGYTVMVQLVVGVQETLLIVNKENGQYGGLVMKLVQTGILNRGIVQLLGVKKGMDKMGTLVYKTVMMCVTSINVIVTLISLVYLNVIQLLLWCPMLIPKLIYPIQLIHH
jgi:hypothetical protein